MKNLGHVAVAIAAMLCLGGGEIAEWKTLKSRHFVVFYGDGKEFAERTLGQAEKSYKQIATDLGFPRHDKKWLWDNRAKIYIYANRKAFAAATGAPRWAGGKASQSEKAVCGVMSDAGFLKTVLPHELAHLMFRDLVGFKGPIPLWLDEGVAVWAERGRRGTVSDEARELARKSNLIPLQQLMTMDIRKSDDRAQVQRFYAQAASLVGYLVSRKGSDKFRKVCRVIRDGKNLENALRSAYPDSIRTIGELQKAWIKYLLESGSG